MSARKWNSPEADERELVKKTLISGATEMTSLRTALYLNLARSWDWPSPSLSLPSTPDCELPRLRCYAENVCHAMKCQHYRLLDADAIDSVCREVVAPAAQVALNYRYGNDPRYAPDIATMLSFKVPDNPSIYHFFLRGPSAPNQAQLRLLLESLLAKPIIMFAKKPMKAVEGLVERGEHGKWENFRIISHEINTKNSNVGCLSSALGIEVLGQPLCLAHFRNVYDQFANVSAEALDHVGSDLYAYEEYVQLHETMKPHSIHPYKKLRLDQ